LEAVQKDLIDNGAGKIHLSGILTVHTVEGELLRDVFRVVEYCYGGTAIPDRDVYIRRGITLAGLCLLERPHSTDHLELPV
jgi:hypothetical protein